MDYVFDYLMFLAQAVTVVVAIVVVVSFAAGIKVRQQGGNQGYLAVTKLNERLRDLRYVMEEALLTPQEAKRRHKSEQKSQKATDKETAAKAKRPPNIRPRRRWKATALVEFLWFVLKAMLRRQMLITSGSKLAQYSLWPAIMTRLSSV